jgi:hypothetical protein
MSDALVANVRGTSRDEYNAGSDSQLQLTKGGELLVASGFPDKTELARLGARWSMAIPTGSAFTNVAALPTTRSELSLYNGELSGGKSYLIDQISFLSLTSITAAAGITIVWQVGSPAALTDNTAVLINSPLGMVYNGRGLRALATTTHVANKWTIAAGAAPGAAASIGLGVVADIDGGIIVRPGYTLGVNVVAGTAVGTSLMGISWIEVDL